MHENFRQTIMDSSQDVWSCRPDIALTLLTTWPSGHESVVSARDAVVQLLPAAVKLPAARQVRGVLHQTYAELPIPLDTLFVGRVASASTSICMVCPSPLTLFHPKSLPAENSLMHGVFNDST